MVEACSPVTVRPLRLVRWLAALLLASCGSNNPVAPAMTRPLPTLTLVPGSFTFTVDGVPRPVLSRNVTGESVAQIDGFLDQAASAGSTLIRIHVIHGLGSGVTPAGAVDEAWASNWDAVFDHAASVGLYVAPVFAVWADWNDGTPDNGFANWSHNPWNAANGGPASDPSELWQTGTAVRTGWMAWLGALVNRWQGRSNVAAWEVFSELDIATGADQTASSAFAADAAAVVRAEDTRGRPVMASLTFGVDWPALSGSNTVDIVQIHPYADPLDTVLLGAVGPLRAEYGKPVLIGESGLSAAAPTGGTATTAPQAPLDVKHAIWAGVVSGAMNARALWWEDGYAIYEPPGVAFVDSYADAEVPAAKFAAGLNLTGAGPLTVGLAPYLVGGAVGGPAQIAGWVRSAACTAATEPCTTPLSGETVTITAPAGVPSWTLTFVDTSTGAVTAGGGGVVTVAGGTLVVTLPTITDDLAFTLVPAGG